MEIDPLQDFQFTTAPQIQHSSGRMLVATSREVFSATNLFGNRQSKCLVERLRPVSDSHWRNWVGSSRLGQALLPHPERSSSRNVDRVTGMGAVVSAERKKRCGVATLWLFIPA
jgi:hypothetical protein